MKSRGGMVRSSKTALRRGGMAALMVLMTAGATLAMQKPSADEVAEMKRTGVFAERVAAAEANGNHKVAPELIQRLQYNVQRAVLEQQGAGPGQIRDLLAPPPDWQGRMPTKGTVKVLGLLIDFTDYPHYAGNTSGTVTNDVFGAGNGLFPYESLTNFYTRSSYGQLDIQGTILGWHTYGPRPALSTPQSDYTTRENIIKSAFNAYNASHDFSQYDNDGDGDIDYFFVIWSGPDGGWSTFWWGYQTGFQDSTYVVDGVTLSTYSWQWEHRSGCSGTPTVCTYLGPFYPNVLIHETGHALGLPDYYDYDNTVGPNGGLGDLDQMDANWGDHNCFSKTLLEWIRPSVYNAAGSWTAGLAPSGTSPNAALVMPSVPEGDQFNEFFMVQNRSKAGNDNTSGWPVTNGLVVWHVDARLLSGRDFLYDNSYTAHKLLMLEQADGLGQIEASSASVDAADFYVPGKSFTPATSPNSNRYDGSGSGVSLSGITGPVGNNYSLTVGLTGGTAGEEVLFDHMANTISFGYSSQNYQALYDASDVQSADDFLLTGPATITRVDVEGFYSNTDWNWQSPTYYLGGPVNSVNVWIYQDAGGQPGTEVYSATVVPSQPAASGWGLPLTSPPILGAGTYWVSVQANMDYPPQWYWDMTMPTYGSYWMQRYPNAGNVWVNVAAPDTAYDLSFRVVGIPHGRQADTVLDFGAGTGVWANYNGNPATWGMIHGSSPEAIAVGDLNANGLDDVVLDLGASGVWANYDNSASSWRQIHALSPGVMAVGEVDGLGGGKADVVLDFGGAGVWVNYNDDPSLWRQVHPATPQQVVLADLDNNGQMEVVLDLGASGVWANYNDDPYWWRQIHTGSPEAMAAGDFDANGQDDLVFDFGASGVWANYNDSASLWQQLHTVSPDGMAVGDLDGDGQDDVVFDFGASGVWANYVYAGTWRQVHPSNPEMLTCADVNGGGLDDVVLDFGAGTGVWINFDDSPSSWQQIHPSSPEDLAAGQIDGQ